MKPYVYRLASAPHEQVYVANRSSSRVSNTRAVVASSRDRHYVEQLDLEARIEQAEGLNRWNNEPARLLADEGSSSWMNLTEDRRDAVGWVPRTAFQPWK